LVARGTGSGRPLGLGRASGWLIYTPLLILIGAYQYERWKQQKVEHKPATTYVVSVFEKPHWRRLLTTKDKEEAEALEQGMVQDGVKVQIEEITPKVKRCRNVARHRRFAMLGIKRPSQVNAGF
jgi:hypothetical protein